MARRKPGTMKDLKNDYQRILDPQKAPKGIQAADIRKTVSDPGRYGPIYDTPAPAPAPARPRPKPRPQPKAAPRKQPPLPPRRPKPPGGGTPIPWVTPEPVAQPAPMPMPQYDPMGNPTGPISPPAPGSSTQGYPPAPMGPTDMIPPQTGPLSDRGPGAGVTANTDPGEAWRNAVTGANPAPLPEGQSAAGALMGGIGNNVSNWAAQQNAAGMPQQGPMPGGGTMQPPQSLLDMANPYLKKMGIPPFGGI